MTLRSLDMWSASENAVVTWTLARRKGHDEGGNPWETIVAERVDDDGNVIEELRFSVSHTDDELKTYARDVNRRRGHDRNLPEAED